MKVCLWHVVLFITEVIIVQSDGKLSQPNVNFVFFLKPFLAWRKLRVNIGTAGTDLICLVIEVPAWQVTQY